MTKGNVSFKHQNLPLALVSLDETQLAIAITVDDDITLFRNYIQKVSTRVALDAVCSNEAGYCSIWMIQHRLNEIQDERYFQLFNCGLSTIATYPDKEAQKAALCEFYNYLGDDRHAILRLELYAANRIIQNTGPELRVNWNSGVPDNYRGQYYWYTVDLNAILEARDVLQLWRSIFSLWDQREADHVDDVRSRDRILTFISHQSITVQYLAIKSIDYMEFKTILSYLEHNYRLDDHGHILLPIMPFTIQYFNLLESGYTPSSPSPWSNLHRCLLLHIYGPWTQHIEANFTSIINALDDCQIYMRLTPHQLKITGERLYEFWKSRITSVSKDRALPNGWLYMKHIPLLKYMNFTLDIASTNYEVRSALIYAVKESNSLGQIPPKYLPLFINALPQLISAREFRYHPSLVIQRLEVYSANNGVGPSPGLNLDPDFLKEIASYLFTMDQDSPLLEYLGWRECIKLFHTSKSRVKMLMSRANYTKRFRHALAYYFHDHPDNIYILNAQSCLYGLETYGQRISLHVLKLSLTLLRQVPLPPLTITTDRALDRERIRLLLALYEQNGLSNLLKLESIVFLEFVKYHHDITYLHDWIISNESQPRFDVSSIVWSTCSNNWIKLMIEHGIIDHDTVKTDDPLLTEYLIDIVQCPICYDIVYEADIHTTSCAHKFHRKCLEQWLSAHISCPVCRANLGAYESGSMSRNSSSSSLTDFWV